MTRKRCVTCSSLTAGELRKLCELDIENEVVLVLAEHGQTNSQRNEGTNERSRHGLPAGQLAVIDGQTKSVDYVDHRVELENPLPVRRNEIKRINDGREVEPGGEHHLQNVGYVAIINVGRGKEERYAQGEDNQGGDRHGQVQPGGVQRVPHEEHQQEHGNQGQEEVDGIGHHGGDGEYQLGYRHLLDQIAVAHN